MNINQLADRVGETPFAASDWLEVTQPMIDQFADVTRDDQFIHIDPDRARRETPFDGTIAHGFLTLSLLTHLLEAAVPPVKKVTIPTENEN